MNLGRSHRRLSGRFATRLRRPLLFLLVWLSSLGGATASAQPSLQDYPQWRGPQRDGAAAGFVGPAVWPATLTRRWKVEVGGGYGTPLVIGGSVYVFTRREGREILTALNAETGHERWQSSYLAPYAPSDAAGAHGAGPKATPLFHEGKLFTLGISGIVSAFDAATGKRLWQTTPPSEAPYFGAASSPLGAPGLVIVHPGNYGPLTAFDSGTGAVKWMAGGDGFFSSPIMATLAGTRQIVSATLDSIIGVSLEGNVLWRYPWEGGGGSITPVLNGDTVLVSALDKGVTALRPTVLEGVWSADAVWKTTAVSMYLSNPVVIANTLFGLSHRASGQFFALDTATGEVLWVGSPREAANTAVVKAGELLLLLNDDAELIVAHASRRGFEPVVRYTVGDSATWAQPAISGQRLFIKDVSSLSLWTF